MHELSVSSAIVDTVLKHAAGRRVSVVSLRLGALRQVVPESLSFYFEIVGRDTLCEDARLDLEMVTALMHCGSCGNEWDPAPSPEHGDELGRFTLPQFRCPECRAAGASVVHGDELEVESIEVESKQQAANSQQPTAEDSAVSAYQQSDPAAPRGAGPGGTGREAEDSAGVI